MAEAGAKEHWRGRPLALALLGAFLTFSVLPKVLLLNPRLDVDHYFIVVGLGSWGLVWPRRWRPLGVGAFAGIIALQLLLLLGGRIMADFG